ncbi:hypothetical protein J0H58_03570 [bacterium]|nr:hypothetical protein [bacterium]
MVEVDIEARVATDFAPADRGDASGLLGLLAPEVDGSAGVSRLVVAPGACTNHQPAHAGRSPCRGFAPDIDR